VKLSIAAVGTAEPAVVWDRYVGPARWPEWSPQIRSVDCPDEVIRSGSRGTVHGPCGVGVDFEVLDIDGEKLRWSWRVLVAGIRLTMDHGVDAGDFGTGTRTTLDISGPAPIVLGYAPLARLALGRLVR